MKNIFHFNNLENTGASGTNTSRTTFFQHVYIHPCVIKGEKYIVYPRGLSHKSPLLFNNLCEHYTLQGYKLKEDQRRTDSSTPFRNQRRRWAAIVLFTSSLFFESSANADIEINIENAADRNSHIELSLVKNTELMTSIQTKFEKNNKDKKITSSIENQEAGKIFSILSGHYAKQDSDPEYIIEDFKLIADYYSGFPEVIRLLNELHNKNWKLKFNEDTWVTTANGSFLQIDDAVIHFNTRNAAQLRLNNSCKDNPVCIASPADALLHELLHTYGILLETKKFLAQGGMNNVLYPYKHEYAVIDAERNLYKSMSKRDGIKRPQRYEHRGRLVKAHCPTCIK